MNKVFVTGANGCIGNILVRRLAGMGRAVTALALDENDSDLISGIERIGITHGDVCHEKTMRDVFSCNAPDIVIHLAALVHRPDAKEEDYLRVNYGATRLLFDLSKEFGVKQFVFASTVAVYGEEPEGTLDENTPTQPGTPYALSKLLAEQHMKDNHDERMMYTIVRPATVYGKHDRGNIDRLVRMTRRGVVPIVGRGDNVKSFVYVENLVDGIVRTLGNELAFNQTFILCDREPYSINTILAEIQKALNKRAIVLHLPEGLLVSALRAVNTISRVSRKKDVVNISSISKLRTSNRYAIGKAEKMLGYMPEYDLSEGLKKIYGR